MPAVDTVEEQVAPEAEDSPLQPKQLWKTDDTGPWDAALDCFFFCGFNTAKFVQQDEVDLVCQTFGFIIVHSTSGPFSDCTHGSFVSPNADIENPWCQRKWIQNFRKGELYGIMKTSRFRRVL